MEMKLRMLGTGSFKSLHLTTGQYRALGEEMLAAEKRRISLGINAEGNRAKPLSKGYAAMKARLLHIGRPIRDMKLTGLTMRDFRVVRAWGGIIRAEPVGREARKRAMVTQFQDQMIGYTRLEEKAVVGRAEAMFAKDIQALWENRR